ncbi:MAG: hypothetical protein GY810_09970 [Aureispira sp.]|nr:hypothetical protein [Aureispira sp.]
MRNVSKSLMLVALLLAYLHQLSAQDNKQLISSTTKTFKAHWGIEGGVGANYLFNDLSKSIGIQNESSTTNYGMRLAPRVDAQFGLFSELEFKRWGMKIYGGYLGKTVPKPIDLTGAEGLPSYNMAYVHNFIHNFMFYFKPTTRLRIGGGLEHHMAFMGKKRMEGELQEYWDGLNLFMGLRTEVGYQLSPRAHLNTYVIVGKYSSVESSIVDNVSAGVTISYRLKGKEYEIKKDIYKINYESVELPKAPKSIGH